MPSFGFKDYEYGSFNRASACSATTLIRKTFGHVFALSRVKTCTIELAGLVFEVFKVGFDGFCRDYTRYREGYYDRTQ